MLCNSKIVNDNKITLLNSCNVTYSVIRKEKPQSFVSGNVTIFYYKILKKYNQHKNSLVPNKIYFKINLSFIEKHLIKEKHSMCYF